MLITSTAPLLIPIWHRVTEFQSLLLLRQKISEIRRTWDGEACRPRAHKELDLLKNNAQSIEKYAREKYMMKKDNEDLFILKSPSEGK